MTESEIFSLIEATKFHNIPADYLKSLVKPCITINTQPLNESSILGISKIGGLPDLPENIVWPSADGQSLVFIAQFRLSDLSEFDEGKLLPQTGMLYFFYDTDPFRGNHQVLYHPSETAPLIRYPLPEDLPKEKLYRVCLVTFSKQYTLPNYESIYFPYDSSSDIYWEDQDQYFRLLQKIRPKLCHQLLGHAYSLQVGMENYKTEFLLFQVDEDRNAHLAWPLSGMLYYWIEESDLLSRNFRDTWTILLNT